MLEGYCKQINQLTKQLHETESQLEHETKREASLYMYNLRTTVIELRATLHYLIKLAKSDRQGYFLELLNNLDLWDLSDFVLPDDWEPPLFTLVHTDPRNLFESELVDGFFEFQPLVVAHSMVDSKKYWRKFVGRCK